MSGPDAIPGHVEKKGFGEQLAVHAAIQIGPRHRDAVHHAHEGQGIGGEAVRQPGKVRPTAIRSIMRTKVRGPAEKRPASRESSATRSADTSRSSVPPARSTIMSRT